MGKKRKVDLQYIRHFVLIPRIVVVGILAAGGQIRLERRIGEGKVANHSLEVRRIA